MSAWRRQGIEMLPELAAKVSGSGSPMMLWIDLASVFDSAMSNSDESLATRILRFAAWCVSEHSGSLPNDTSTATACAFYEHLPSNKSYWPHFRKWFSPSEFARLAPIFAYHLSATEFEQLKKEYAVAEA